MQTSMHKINESHQHFLCFVKPCRIFVFCMLLFFLFLVQNKCWKSLQNSIVGCVYSSRIRFYVFLCNRPSCIIQKQRKSKTIQALLPIDEGCINVYTEYDMPKKIFAPKMGGGKNRGQRIAKKRAYTKGEGVGYKRKSIAKKPLFCVSYR